MSTTHQPKGGMCATCKHIARDCSSLRFDSMPVIGKDVRTGALIVKCVAHEKKESNDV